MYGPRRVTLILIIAIFVGAGLAAPLLTAFLFSGLVVVAVSVYLFLACMYERWNPKDWE